MTTDIDAGLHRLASANHPGLIALEDAVMARVRERRRSEMAFGTPLVALAALGAIALGTTAGAVSAAPAASLSPFGPSSPLAPSTLLAADR